MKAMKLVPIAMFLTLILGALPAAAGQRSQRSGDAGLERLSHKLVTATAELRDEMATSRRGWRIHQRYTLRALNRLEHDAKAFHRRVEREGVSDRSTRRAFRSLEASFAAVSERIPATRNRRVLRRDFAQVVALMEKVEARMARADHRRDGRHHARNGHTDRWRIAGNFGY
jgi:hypothetical protein